MRSPIIDGTATGTLNVLPKFDRPSTVLWAKKLRAAEMRFLIRRYSNGEPCRDVVSFLLRHAAENFGVGDEIIIWALVVPKSGARKSMVRKRRLALRRLYSTSMDVFGGTKFVQNSTAEGGEAPAFIARQYLRSILVLRFSSRLASSSVDGEGIIETLADFWGVSREDEQREFGASVEESAPEATERNIFSGSPRMWNAHYALPLETFATGRLPVAICPLGIVALSDEVLSLACNETAIVAS
jgi:hypothetical protein